MRVVNHDGVGVRYVNAVLDNLRCHQDIVLVIAKGDEDLLHLLGGELPVGDGYSCIWDLALDQGGEVLNVADAAIDEVHLPIAAHLEAHRLTDDLWGRLREQGLHGTAVGRGRVEVRQVTCAHQGELERAWNGGGTHRERIDIDLKLAELLLGGDTELLLLIDDEETEVTEGDILARQAVCADDDVDLPLS